MVVTWSIPVPAKAKVAYETPRAATLFHEVAKWSGGDIPEGFNSKYLEEIHEVEIFNSSQLWDLQELMKWEERFEIRIEREPAQAFDKYFESGHAVFGTLVNHPNVPDPAVWALCDIVLQRAVIMYTGNRETILFRSYFHSAKDDTNFVNFVPNRAVEVSFESPTVFFPLALTEFISAPEAHVMLDIVTPQAASFQDVPKGLEVIGSVAGRVAQERYYITRIHGVLKSGEAAPDMNLRF